MAKYFNRSDAKWNLLVGPVLMIAVYGGTLLWFNAELDVLLAAPAFVLYIAFSVAVTVVLRMYCARRLRHAETKDVAA